MPKLAAINIEMKAKRTWCLHFCASVFALATLAVTSLLHSSSNVCRIYDFSNAEDEGKMHTISGLNSIPLSMRLFVNLFSNDNDLKYAERVLVMRSICTAAQHEHTTHTRAHWETNTRSFVQTNFYSLRVSTVHSHIIRNAQQQQLHWMEWRRGGERWWKLHRNSSQSGNEWKKKVNGEYLWYLWIVIEACARIRLNLFIVITILKVVNLYKSLVNQFGVRALARQWNGRRKNQHYEQQKAWISNGFIVLLMLCCCCYCSSLQSAQPRLLNFFSRSCAPAIYVRCLSHFKQNNSRHCCEGAADGARGEWTMADWTEDEKDAINSIQIP